MDHPQPATRRELKKDRKDKNNGPNGKYSGKHVRKTTERPKGK